MKSLEEPREFKTCHDFYRRAALRLTFVTFQFQIPLLLLRSALLRSLVSSSVSNNIPFVSKLLLLIEGSVFKFLCRYLSIFSFISLGSVHFGRKICIKFQIAGSKTLFHSLALSPIRLDHFSSSAFFGE